MLESQENILRRAKWKGTVNREGGREMMDCGHEQRASKRRKKKGEDRRRGGKVGRDGEERR